MFSSLDISTDYWRHFIPVAPDIDITVVLGEEIFIDLRPFIIQGARDFFDQSSPDTNVIPDKVPSQRGWRLEYFITVPPKKGTIKKETFLNGFIYKPDKGAGNSNDCFNYQLSNGTQLSHHGKINITIIKQSDNVWEIIGFRPDANAGIDPVEFEMRMSVKSTHVSYPLYSVKGFKWFVENIRVVDGYVVKTMDLVHSFRTYMNSSTDETYVISDGAILPKRMYKTDKDILGIDPSTQRRYVPTNKFPMVICEFWNFPHKRQGEYGPVTDMSRPEIKQFKIQDFHSIDWNLSGSIKLPE
jgi:hypothetical protein